jgi:succinate-semialdehyde dehydrogenase/glutarate-semialdehyde dehydrogenase
MTSEMGKTVTDGGAEVDKCASACEHFAEHAARYLARQNVTFGGPRAFVAFNPLGVVLAVMPWNFPFWQVFRFAAPGLMAGNGAVLKHASNVPGCALAIESVFREAGFPDGLFATVLIKSQDVKALIEDANIAAVTLTGSVAAGRSVATIAGSQLKKCVLELGGSDAYVVLEDADVAAAAKVCAAARMVNAGQSCIAGKRFIVVRPLREAFEQALVVAMRAYSIGDPRDPATKLGPLQSVDARDQVHEQVQQKRRQRERSCCSAGRSRPARRLVSGDRARQRQARPAGARRRGLRPGRRRHRSSRRGRTQSQSPTPASSGSARACSRAISRAASGSRPTCSTRA